MRAKSDLNKKQGDKTTDKPSDTKSESNAANKEAPVRMVTKLLEERTKKTRKEQNAEKPKRKLTHVTNFVREKTAGSIEYDDGDVKGKIPYVVALNPTNDLEALDYETAPVPRLSFGLDRVLFK